ncbi:MAG: RHS repeat-associated core domain-containing protein [Pseudomonadota bacterium]
MMNRLTRLLALLSLSAPCAIANPLGSGEYEVYRGLVNGDSYEDIYLKSDQSILIIAGQPVIPIEYAEGDSFLLTGTASGAFTSPIVDNTVDVSTLTNQLTGVVSGDFDGDSTLDLLVQGSTATDNSIFLIGDSTGGVPTLDSQSTSLNGQDISIANAQISSIDDNTDGYSDLVVTYVLGGSTVLTNSAEAQLSFEDSAILSTETPTETSTLAGGLPYRLRVDDKGQTLISIPIQTPPGVRNMNPNLSLSYSSGGTRRLIDDKQTADSLGYGWTLAGISEIRRCRYGVGGSLTLDGNDVLCLDGNVLNLDSGSSYWADNATYRVENRPTVKVEANGALSNETRTFKVLLADGREQTFGSQPAARVSPSNSSVVYSWKLSATEDDYGNMMNIEWISQASDGVSVPRLIHYDGSQVEFRYTEREDTTEVNLGDEMVPGVTKQPLVLDQIITSVNDGAGIKRVSQIIVDTNLDPSSTYRRLDNIQRCGYELDGTSKSCQQPTNLTWVLGSYLEDEFNNAISKIDNGVGRWDEIDYELLAGTGSHPLGITGCDLCTYGGTPYTLAVERLSTRRLAVKEHRASPIDAGGNNRKSTFKYYQNAWYGINGEGFTGFQATARTLHDLPLHQLSSSTDTYHDITIERKHAHDLGYLGRSSFVEEIIKSSVEGKLSHKYRAIKLEQHANTKRQFFSSEWRERYESGAVVSVEQLDREYCFTSLSGPSGTCQSGAKDHVVQETVTRKSGANFTGLISEGPGWGVYTTGTLAITGELTSQTHKADVENDVSNWVLGFIERVEEVHDSSTTSPATRVATYTKNGSKRDVGSRILFPGDADLELTTSFVYDGVGNLTEVETVGVDVPLRKTTRSNFVNNRFSQTLTDAQTKSSNLLYDMRFGQPSSLTNPDAQDTTVVYDVVGRVISRTSPNGDVTTNTWSNCASSSVCNHISWGEPSTYVVITVRNNTIDVQPERRIFYDQEGRQLLSEVAAFAVSSGWRSVESHYDSWGRMLKRSRPYHSSTEIPIYIDYKVDEHNRVVKENRPDGSKVETTYAAAAGYLSVLTSELVLTPGQSNETQEKLSLFDSAGRLASTTDAFNSFNSVMTSYTYTSHGLLDTVEVEGMEVADMDYDNSGNRIQIIESNTGTTDFRFAANGLLVESTDAEGQVTEFDYDLLDRLVTQGEDCSPSSCAETRSWTYDPVNGYGQIETASAPGVTQTYSYFSSGLLEKEEIAIAGIGSSVNGTRSIEYSYTDGRISSVTYPSVQPFSFEYEGAYLARIKRGSNVLDEVDEINADGTLAQKILGNGLVSKYGYDSNTGRLTSIKTGTTGTPASIQDLEYVWRSNAQLHQRKDLLPGTDLIETFQYDGLNRVTDADESTSGRSLDFTYDYSGNLLSKTSDVTGDIDVTGFQYTIAGKPHRLNQATIDGISTSFAYDNNGNITSYDATGSVNDTTIEYDGRNRAKKITLGHVSSPTARDEFWYGANGERFVRKASWLDGSTTKVSWTVYLLGGVYEEVVPEHDSSVDLYRKVQVSSSVLHRIKELSAGGVTTINEYTHRDHLGSIDVVTSSTSSVLHEMSFDVFGARRESNWAQDITTGSFTTILYDVELNTSRGFTDHEMLDRINLVHMNGRMYDAQIGRFLQADPLVQAPVLSQNYNRYSYVLNSPTSFVDRTGFYCNDCPSGPNFVDREDYDELGSSQIYPNGGTDFADRDDAQENWDTFLAAADPDYVDPNPPLDNLQPVSAPSIIFGVMEDILTPADREVVPPELQSVAQTFAEAAQIATRRVDSGPCFDGCSPLIRGSRIHAEFANIVNELDEGLMFRSEESQIPYGVLVPYGTKGSKRADAVFGPPGQNPLVVVELKTSNAYVSRREALRYKAAFPDSFLLILEERGRR